MRLDPKRPPGRSTRKALAFASEIARLHADGYSCEAIRQALEDAGLTVSRSTVIREVALLSKRSAPRPEASHVTPRTGSLGAGSTTSAALPSPSDWRSGKDIATAWMKDRITNPLLRSRINDESSGH